MLLQSWPDVCTNSSLLLCRSLHLAGLGIIPSVKAALEIMKTNEMSSLMRIVNSSTPHCKELFPLLCLYTTNPVPVLSEQGPVGPIPPDLTGLTPLHLVACWSPSQRSTDNGDSTTSSSSKTILWTLTKEERQRRQLTAVKGLCAALKANSQDLSVHLNRRAGLGGETPLTCAAYSGSEQLGQVLIDCCANVDMPRLLDGEPGLACCGWRDSNLLLLYGSVTAALGVTSIISRAGCTAGSAVSVLHHLFSLADCKTEPAASSTGGDTDQPQAGWLQCQALLHCQRAPSACLKAAHAIQQQHARTRQGHHCLPAAGGAACQQVLERPSEAQQLLATCELSHVPRVAICLCV
jgi:hypothetical protein